MNRLTRSRIVAILAAVASSGMTVEAAAQTSPSAGPPPAASSPLVSPSGVDHVRPKNLSANVERHISQLHDQLGITPAEQPQWEQCVQVMRDNAAQMNQALMDRGTKVKTMSAVDNMQSYAQLAQVHATNMQKLASVFQSLYSSFPDQQKQVADAVFRKNAATRTRHAS